MTYDWVEIALAFGQLLSFYMVIPSITPSEETARRIVEKIFPTATQFSLQRFSTGRCHYVYDFRSGEGDCAVIRIARSDLRKYLEVAIYWNSKLRRVGIPLPKILHQDLGAEHPYLVLERFPGVDLLDVYSNLTSEEKRDRKACLRCSGKNISSPMCARIRFRIELRREDL